MGMKKRFVNINKKIICFVIFISILGVSTVQSMYGKEEVSFTNNYVDNSEILSYSAPKAFIFGEITNINERGFFTTFNAAHSSTTDTPSQIPYAPGILYSVPSFSHLYQTRLNSFHLALSNPYHLNLLFHGN